MCRPTPTFRLLLTALIWLALVGEAVHLQGATFDDAAPAGQTHEPARGRPAGGRSLPDGQLEAERLLQEGPRAFEAGDFAAAARAWQESVKLLAGSGRSDQLCDACLRLSGAQSALGRQPAAIAAANRALEEARRLGDDRRAALAQAARGRAAMFSTSAAQSEADLQEARNLAGQIGDDRLLAQLSNDLGNLYSSRGDLARALPEYDQATALARRHNDPTTAATAATNAVLAVAQEPGSDVSGRVATARELVASLDDGYIKGHLQLNLAMAELRRLAAGAGDAGAMTASAYELATASRDLASRLGNPLLEAHAWGRLGELYASCRRIEEAMFATRKAVFLAQQAQLPDALFVFQWQLGRLLRDAGQIDPAIEAYRRALSLLTQRSLANIRHDLAIGYGNSNSRRSFRQTIGPVFYETADLLLRRADRQDDPRQVQESLGLARQTVEELKSAELEDYFQDDCVNLIRQKARGIDVGLVNTAVVYLIPLADRTEVLISLPSGLSRCRADVSEPVLTSQVKALRARLEDDLDYEYRSPAERLYDWLIRPIVPTLREAGITTLVFVPDGELRTIPMAALRDRETGEHLIEQFAVAVSPGLQLLEPAPLSTRRNVELLAAGLSEAVQEFPPLPGVPQELSEIRNLYGGVQLQDQAFIRPRFAEQLRQDSFTIVHIASHGKFAGSARDTFVLTWDGKLYLNDLEKLIQPSQFRGQPVELLTLSACQTAAGEDSARAALGLAGVAIKAGARSALASLWSVNDAASSQLIAEFYRQLRTRPEQSKSQALRAAQLTLLKQQNTRHPRYWAPFLIIGNWM
ncbi:MAG: CHAT domain-containing protein [Phycisphaerales bacterium]|nr:CHAT domain-containing protein [Phycisphaerales bacterium]